MNPWFPTIGSDPSWGIVASGAVALSGLCLRGFTRTMLPCLLVAISGFWALETVLMTAFCPETGPIQRVAWSCAAMSMWWSIVGARDTRLHRARLSHDPRSSRFAVLARGAALLLGVTSGTILLTILSMQGIFALVDLMRGHPALRLRDFGFNEGGLWSLGFLIVGGAVAFWSTRDRRLPACLLVGVTALAAWSCLLQPVYRLRSTGGYERTSAVLMLGLAFAGILGITGVLARRRVRRALHRPFRAGPSVSNYPGIPACATILSVLCLGIGAYHLVVPIRLSPGGARLASGLLTVAGAVGALGSLSMLRLRWSAYLADATLTLASITLCAAITAFIPEHPTALADRFPMIFNAIMLGLVVSSVACAFTAHRMSERGESTTSTSDDRLLISWLKRFSFFNAAMALVAGGMMAIWPSLPTIATMDDSLLRVSTGTAGHLALIAGSMYGARRVRRSTFHALTVLAVLATGAFVVARMLPFTSHVG